MDFLRAVGAGLAGAVVAVLVGTATVPPTGVALPLVGLAVGSVTGLALARAWGAQKYFDTVGGVLALAAGLGVAGLAGAVGFPRIYSTGTHGALVFFGSISAAFVGLRQAVRLCFRAVGRLLSRFEYTSALGRLALKVADLVSVVSSVVVLAWSVVRLEERLVRTGALSIVTPLAFLLSLVNRVVDLPGVLTPVVDVAGGLFVACVVIGFHTLASWYTMLALVTDPAFKEAGARGKEAVTDAGGAATDAARRAGSRSREAVDAAGESVRGAGETVRDAGTTVRGTVAGDGDADGNTDDTVSRDGRDARDARTDRSVPDLPGMDLIARVVGVDPPRSSGSASGDPGAD